MKINKELVGIRIMQKRKEYGYSQEQLAELIGISKNHLSSIERGHNLPTSKLIENISNVLGGSFDYYYLGRINQETEEKIIHLFQNLTENEQTITIKLIESYIDNRVIFD